MAREDTTQRRLLGVVDVDSGTLLVGDPAYVLPDADAGKTGVDYAEVVAVPMSEDVAPLAGRPVLLLQNFGGDGTYPIYGEFDGPDLARVVIELADLHD